ncbi:hypothetical protein FKM82_025593 [Ascaphus truei]
MSLAIIYKMSTNFIQYSSNLAYIYMFHRKCSCATHFLRKAAALLHFGPGSRLGKFSLFIILCLLIFFISISRAYKFSIKKSGTT